MASGNSRTWTVGTLLLCGAIGAVGYLFAIKPALDGVEDVNSQVDEARSFNDLLDQQILAAKTTAKDAPVWRGTLAAIDIDMPPMVEEASLHRMLVESLESRGLPVMGLTYSNPLVLLAPAAEPAPAAESPASGDETSTASPAPSEPNSDSGDEPVKPAKPAAPAVDNLISIPISITTQGSPDAVMTWMRYIQTQDSRFLTLVGFQIGPVTDSTERPGVPPTLPGDWTITLNLMAFSLLDPDRSFPIEPPGSNPPYSSGSFTVPVESDAPAG